MLTFYLFAGLMIIAALGLMLPALLRREPAQQIEADQQQANIDIARENLRQLSASRDSGALSESEFSAQRTELENALALSLQQHSEAHRSGQLSARVLAVILLLVLPLSAALIYRATGMPRAMDPAFVTAMNQPPEASDKLPPIDELLPRLESHLAANPDDLRGWSLLGVTYMRLQRFEDAERALQQSRRLDPGNVEVLMRLVDARAMAQGGRIDSEAESLLDEALALAPDDPRGLWMLGTLKQQQGQTSAAVAIWEKLLGLLADQPEASAAVRDLIAEARGETTPSTSDVASTSGDTNAKPLTVEVALNTEIATDLAPDTPVFIYARAMQGPPMPLAVVRKSVSDLPLTLELSDAQAMMPQLRLSQFDRVVVGARVSMSGDPVASSGDFFAEFDNIEVGSDEPVRLLIDQQIP